MTDEKPDRMKELQDHLKEVSADRDAVLEERRLQGDLLRRIASWVKDHARHGADCVGEGDCSCGLKELKRDLL